MEIKCPHCGQRYDVDEQNVGAIAHCEKCDQDFEIGQPVTLHSKSNTGLTIRIPKAVLWVLFGVAVIAVIGTGIFFVQKAKISSAKVDPATSRFLAYKKAAEQGDAAAQYNLGVCYHNGYGVDKDYKQAVYWYRKAAEQGDAEAQYNLGVCYHNGYGVDKDYKQAVYWYRKAAEQGYAAAQYNLGVCYHNGYGVDKDYTQAAYWCRKAAEQGYAEAQYNLGVCYDLGLGVTEDMAQAVYWYRKAAEQGDTDAQQALEALKEEGKL